MASFNDIKTRLNTQLRDSDGATFTDTEKIEALRTAIEETDVAVVEVNSSTLFTNGTRLYNLGANIDAVYNIEIDTANNGNLIPVERDGWDFIAPNLMFAPPLVSGIPTNSVLYITWLRKLTVDDDIPRLIENYVLNMAHYNVTQLLVRGKINRFLRNDVSMAELLQGGQAALRDAQRLKKKLPKYRFVVV